ncbi:hypothetical protein Cadr_000009775 [Camelus dromedarius]|uniref:Uncharacterized protein n=1 Tax=Camelus dromedarius TaxID=9838 RepID=A0A5N4DHT0_CAMDR|nr:hypothetical protein Cadr_000009775 [Camelus dromedarius]
MEPNIQDTSLSSSEYIAGNFTGDCLSTRCFLGTQKVLILIQILQLFLIRRHEDTLLARAGHPLLGIALWQGCLCSPLCPILADIELATSTSLSLGLGQFCYFVSEVHASPAHLRGAQRQTTRSRLETRARGGWPPPAAALRLAAGQQGPHCSSPQLRAVSAGGAVPAGTRQLPAAEPARVAGRAAKQSWGLPVARLHSAAAHRMITRFQMNALFSLKFMQGLSWSPGLSGQSPGCSASAYAHLPQLHQGWGRSSGDAGQASPGAPPQKRLKCASPSLARLPSQVGPGDTQPASSGPAAWTEPQALLWARLPPSRLWPGCPGHFHLRASIFPDTTSDMKWGPGEVGRHQ